MHCNPVLVTGTHRSGTTWIGKTLNFSRSVEYISEPFNIGNYNPHLSYQFQKWFAYVPEMENEKEIYCAFYEMFRKRDTPVRRFKRMVNDHPTFPDGTNLLKFTALAFVRNRTLMKDPIALRSAGWLADNFDMKVVCTIRHPFRFVSSLKKWNMEFDFSQFLKHGKFDDERIEPFEDQIRFFASNKQGIIAQACLLWNVLNHLIKYYQETRPDWYFVRFEDISKYPLRYFKKIYSFAELKFTSSIEEKIKYYTKGGSTNNIKSNFTARDSKRNLESWKRRLSNEEIDQISAECQVLMNYFYPRYKN